MRRKKRYGVYSNRSIKRCSCNLTCNNCKSICKSLYKNNIDPLTIWHGYFELQPGKLHQMGFGSLRPGCKFAQYEKNHGFEYRYLRRIKTKQYSFRKRDLKLMTQEEVNYYNLISSY